MSRATDLIRDLGLQPHPEGGHYREIHRSAHLVHPADGRPARSALTLIYFLLEGDDRSRWHRVSSDETWQHVEGAPLELLRMDPDLRGIERLRIGPLADGAHPLGIIPAYHWQAARSTGAYSLVACAVGPGFDFADFALLADDPREAGRLREHLPEAAPFL